MPLYIVNCCAVTVIRCTWLKNTFAVLSLCPYNSYTRLHALLPGGLCAVKLDNATSTGVQEKGCPTDCAIRKLCQGSSRSDAEGKSIA